MSHARTFFAATAFAAAALAARPTTAAEPGCGRWVVEVACETTPARVVVGDPFTATLTVKNGGTMDLLKVTVALKGELGAKGVGGAPSTVSHTIEKLAPGESKQVTSTFACDVVGTARVTGGARDGDGFTASNCFCTVDMIGLPAIQSEMTDKDVDGAEKGIFAVGEEFLYVLDVQNDVGSTVTPDLKVVFALPAELAFVSGTADGGVKVTGDGQAASSSAFALVPNQVVKVTLRVKATARPASNLVMTRASIQTTGGVEVAQETESTTIR